MFFSLNFSATTALASITFFSSIIFGRCDTIVPLKSFDNIPVALDGKVVPTKLHVVDPWIRPPRGVETQEAIGLAGDFDLYPRITASPYDRIEFNMRPIQREGDNKQRHGVYVITDKKLVQDYLDGTSEHPCGEPKYTEENLCQVVEYEGLNATDCPSRATLFPLLEIFGSSGEIGYTTYGLADLAEQYGVETETGSHILAFDCPWIQGRNSEGSGRTSHCIGGMYLIVDVLAEADVIESAPSVTSGSNQRLLLSLASWAIIIVALTVF